MHHISLIIPSCQIPQQPSNTSYPYTNNLYYKDNNKK